MSYGAINDEQRKLMAKDGVAKKYSLEGFLTWEVFTVWHGSVFKSATLWTQTALLAVLFWTVYFLTLKFRPEDFSQSLGEEGSIRAFITMFNTLIMLLLSFYTALNLGRWWQMRMGIEAIQDGTKRLVMLVSQGVSADSTLLASIGRYSRASLYLIFAASQHEEGDQQPIEKAKKFHLLDDEEVRKLHAVHAHDVFVHAETLWVWLANVINRCSDQKLTKGAPHYCQLMGAIDCARSGITSIQAYLETPIPLGYVHLLCLMVQLHNFLLQVLMALTCAKHSGGAHGVQPVSVFRTAFRAFFMPFLYNAILMLNAVVVDPFGGDEGDFDWNDYDVSIAMSSESYSKAAENLPDWAKRTDFKPIVNKVDDMA